MTLIRNERLKLTANYITGEARMKKITDATVVRADKLGRFAVNQTCDMYFDFTVGDQKYGVLIPPQLATAFATAILTTAAQATSSYAAVTGSLRGPLLDASNPEVIVSKSDDGLGLQLMIDGSSPLRLHLSRKTAKDLRSALRKALDPK